MGDGAWTDEMGTIFSFVKHHLISQKKQENPVYKIAFVFEYFSPNHGGNEIRQNEAEQKMGQNKMAGTTLNG